VTATTPTSGDPHIEWSIPGVSRTAVDKWTISFALRRPGKYLLDVLVTDRTNTANTKRWALPITVTGLNVALSGKSKLQLRERTPLFITASNGVPPYRLTVSVTGGQSASGTMNRQVAPNGAYQAQFFVPTDTPGNKTVTISVADAKGSTFNRSVVFSVADAAQAPPPAGQPPFVGSYYGTVTGPKEPDANKYWGHVVGRESDGSYTIALYYDRAGSYHVALKPDGTLIMHSNSLAAVNQISGKGRLSGSGGVGSTITMQWTIPGDNQTITTYTWVLTKYSDTDFANPPAGSPSH
jgi:hypothetical protein